MSIKIRKEDALNYHTQGQPGKIEVVPTKVLSSQLDLALAYSPGVAEPCLAIADNKEDVFKYTAKGNLVAVISNGTAVLGLGNIGPEASKPVMEGKGVLFKKFAGIDVFDIEIDESDPEAFIKIVKSLEPTFGGVNLEDIKAPECFRVETELKEKMSIPVMHDDQHGTAIISAAALLNALELAEKKIEELKIVVSGAGASAMACTKLYVSLGASLENIVMLDSKGVIRRDRDNLDAMKAEFATDRDINTLEDALAGADMFLGLSRGNLLNPDHILAMADNPIVFALANPDPEIAYDLATKTREDIIMATGRSDHPNQVNNVLGFPYIFRGALDVRATAINEEMKLAAVKALAELAKEPVPNMVNKAYGVQNLSFSRNYLIPKPLDPRLITKISRAVAQAAMDSGVAQYQIDDWYAYESELRQRIGEDNKLISSIIARAKKDPKRIVFTEADDYNVLKAAQIVKDEQIGIPILLGPVKKVKSLIEENNLDLKDCEVIYPYDCEDRCVSYGEVFYEKRKRRGVTPRIANKLMRDRNYFGAMMVECGHADAMVSGQTQEYPKLMRPVLQSVGKRDDVSKVAGMYIINSNAGTFFFADTTVNIDPSVDELVDIIGMTAEGVRFFDIEPRIAVLSYSNFGSSQGVTQEKASLAVQRAKEKYPGLIIEGDIQANVALNTSLQKEQYPFSALAEKGANTLIFPNLASGNIAYKLLMEIGHSDALGPILLGLNKPIQILQLGGSIREIVNMAAIAVVDAQSNRL